MAHATRPDAVTLPRHSLALIAALAAAVVAQGGYHLAGRILATSLAALAAAAAWHARPPARSDVGPVLLAGGGLAGWAVLRAGLDGRVTAAAPTVLTVFCLLAALFVARRASPAERDLCATAAVGVGALVATTGWIAVVWRIPSWTNVADGLSRLASTLSYANAAAALLGALAVLATARLCHRSTPLLVGATFLLLVGLGATLSRAGVLALLAGLVVLSLLTRVRATIRALAAPALGAIVALGALAPSFPVTTPARPALAIAGLIAGLAIAVGSTRLPARFRGPATLSGFAIAATAAILVAGSGQLGQVLTGRLGFNSPDRGAATRAALDLVATRPVLGAGPGQGWLFWTRPNGDSMAMRYVHNEYLQILVDLGATGLALLLCLLGAIAVTVWRGRTAATPSAPWAGAVAALAVLVVHSGFDFLWHIPAIVLAAGLLIGLAAPQQVSETTEEKP